MLYEVESFVEQYHMIEQGDIVIAGVSGGADSVCLLLVLAELQKKLPFAIEVVHIEHGIRGVESVADADFVRSLCDSMQVPFRQFSYAVPEYAKQNGMSEEEAGRSLRYQTFAKAAEGRAHVKIAVAHNQNDVAETMLLNLVRGSSTKGLAAIPPVRGNIIRPLLQVSRAQIEAYLTEKHQTYRTDATNLSTDYARNKVRHQVLPVLTQINVKALLHMEQTAGDVREMEAYFEQKTLQAIAQYVTMPENRVLLSDKVIEELEPILLRRLLHYCICQCAGSSKDISRVHIEAVEVLLHAQVGKVVILPYGLRARRDYEGICVEKVYCEMDAVPEVVQTTPLEQNTDFSIRIIEKTEKELEFPKKKYTKWIDYDKIKNSLFVRARQSGDYLILDEKGSSKKLKQYFVNEKIPQENRNQIPLVADGSHIVWVVGYRISAFYKVSHNTKRILEIRFDGGQENE